METFFPTIENFVDDITYDLQQRGFIRLQSEHQEVARYQKKDSTSNMQVSIEHAIHNSTAPDYYQVHLNFEYDRPKGVPDTALEKILPTPEVLSAFFGDGKTHYISNIATTDKVKGDRIRHRISMNFKKPWDAFELMVAMTREVIDYSTNYATVTTQMLSKLTTVPL